MCQKYTLKPNSKSEQTFLLWPNPSYIWANILQICPLSQIMFKFLSTIQPNGPHFNDRAKLSVLTPQFSTFWKVKSQFLTQKIPYSHLELCVLLKNIFAVSNTIFKTSYGTCDLFYRWTLAPYHNRFLIRSLKRLGTKQLVLTSCFHFSASIEILSLSNFSMLSIFFLIGSLMKGIK